MGRLLAFIDEWATNNGFDYTGVPPERLPPTRVEGAPPLAMDFMRGEIKTIVWATGYRPDYSWLELPVFDRKGMVRHLGGVVDFPGAYLMGHPSCVGANLRSLTGLVMMRAISAITWRSRSPTRPPGG